MKAISKNVAKKWLAGLLTLAMICGIGPTYAVANAGATPEEVSVSASSRTDAGSSHLFFRTSVEQSSFVGGEMEYKAVSGGVYLDGSETASNIDFFMRNGGSDFFIYFGWFNYAPQVGSTIQIDGTFKYTKGDHQLKVTSGVFTYDGSVWKYDDGVSAFETEVIEHSREDIADSHMFFMLADDDGKFVGGEMYYNAVSGGVYVNDTPYTSVTFRRNGSNGCYFYFPESGLPTPADGMTLRFDGVFQSDASKLKLTSETFKYNAATEQWTVVMPSFETEVIEYSREDIGTSHMFFATVDNDGKFAGEDMYYNAVSGGVYVNDTLYTSVTFRRNGGAEYFFYFPESGLPTPTDGATLRFDGEFQSGKSRLKLTSETFKYNAATSQWTVWVPAFETEVIEYSREDIGTSHMFFATVDNDGKYTGEEMFYNAVSGGIYVNDTLYTSVTFRRNAETAYFIYFEESGLPTPADKAELRFDGEFQSGDSKLKLTSEPFVYDAATCQWTVKDTSFISVEYDAIAFMIYRMELSAPEAEGYVFAGWYADEECTEVLIADTVESVAYAKFVDEKVLTAKAQVTANIDDQTEKADIRFVTTVDSLNYKEVGFYITIGDADQGKKVTKTVYSSLYIVGKDSNEVDTEITPDEFCKASKYFATFSYWNVGKAHFGTEFTVTPYWVTLDGTTVEGQEIVRSVNSVNAAYNQ